MLKKVTGSLLIIAALVLGTAGLFVATASAVDPTTQINKGVEAAGGGSTSADDLPNLIQNIVNVLLFIAGAIAVVMIILGGIRYVTSNGDQAQVKAAKDTILYSVIGLIVALLAYAIVGFVVGSINV